MKEEPTQMSVIRCSCGATIEATSHDVKLGRSFYNRCREAEEARRAGRRVDGRFECSEMKKAMAAQLGKNKAS
jgi:hypothetical protein